MNKKNYKFYMLEGENIITYLVTSEDLTHLEKEIKVYNNEDVVSFHSSGPYMTTREFLRRKALRFHDEIVEAEYDSETIYPGRYGSPVDMKMVAHVKNYPILWHIIFDNTLNRYFEELKMYLNNESGLTHIRGKRIKYLSEVYKILRKESDKKVNYDSNIPNEEKIKFINSFLSSLTFQQVKVETISDINKQIEVLTSIMETKRTNELISTIKGLKSKLELAKDNRESIEWLNNNLNVQKILIKK